MLYPVRKWRESVLSVTEKSCRPGERPHYRATSQHQVVLFRFCTEPFFVDFVIGAILTQRFQRAVDFLAQLIAAFREGNSVLLCFQRFTYRLELAVACGFDKVQDVRRIVQNGVCAVGA